VVVEWDGDARAPRELGDGEVPLLEAELGSVEGLQVDGGEVRAASDPRLLEAPHHVVAHGGLALGGGLVHANLLAADRDHIHESAHVRLLGRHTTYERCAAGTLAGRSGRRSADLATSFTNGWSR